VKTAALIHPLRGLRYDALGEATLTGNYEWCENKVNLYHLLAPYPSWIYRNNIWQLAEERMGDMNILWAPVIHVWGQDV
jgi:hypothetical protein